MQEFLKDAKERGLLYQCTNKQGLENIKNPIAYLGFDLTADSLHIGSLIPIMLARLLQKHQGKILIVVGGGTTRIGDPSGTEKTRIFIQEEIIQKNMSGIQEDLNKFITAQHILNNDTWLKNLLYIDFLRDIGKYFSINKMLRTDSVRLRLERQQPLSFIEFNYMLAQAYDFLHLFRTFNCQIQFGGSDQWGNIVNGINLIHQIEKKTAYGITTPLLTTTSGKKMGKTNDGTIWLNAKKLSPYNYYQYWRNVEDFQVITYLKLFTEYPLQKIKKLDLLKGNDINIAKKILAYECTALCHGESEAKKSQETAEKIFVHKSIGENLPTITIHKDIGLLEALCLLGLTISNSEARRFVLGKSVRLNNQLIIDPTIILTRDFFKNGILKISSSKKKHGIIKWV